jgi:hypothetical protein
VSRIKQLYREINLEEEFEKYSKKISAEIFSNVSKLSAPELKQLTQWLHATTDGRKK